MSTFSGASLSGAISQGVTAVAKGLPARFASTLDGIFNGLRRSTPNDSTVADGSIGRFSIPRAELAQLAQTQTADPIGQLLRNSSRAWTGIGAQEATV